MPLLQTGVRQSLYVWELFLYIMHLRLELFADLCRQLIVIKSLCEPGGQFQAGLNLALNVRNIQRTKSLVPPLSLVLLERGNGLPEFRRLLQIVLHIEELIVILIKPKELRLLIQNSVQLLLHLIHYQGVGLNVFYVLHIGIVHTESRDLIDFLLGLDLHPEIAPFLLQVLLQLVLMYEMVLLLLGEDAVQLVGPFINLLHVLCDVLAARIVQFIQKHELLVTIICALL